MGQNFITPKMSWRTFILSKINWPEVEWRYAQTDNSQLCVTENGEAWRLLCSVASSDYHNMVSDLSYFQGFKATSHDY